MKLLQGGTAFAASLRPSRIMPGRTVTSHASSCRRNARALRPVTSILQTPLREKETESVSTRPSRKPQFGSVAPRKAPELHVSSDSIAATFDQSALVAIFGALSVAEFAHIVSQISNPMDFVGVVAALIGGWAFADFGSAVYHWAVDNYGNESTPIFGFQIAAFQGHHTSPWTITNRDFANNIYRLTHPTIPQMAFLLVAPIPTAVAAGICSALFWIVASQELHRQAHMPRPHIYARVLQNIGVAISRKDHGQHHSSPFEGNYGIVSGLCNPLLDESLFFRRLEAMIYRHNGAEPISWSLDPDLRNQALEL